MNERQLENLKTNLIALQQGTLSYSEQNALVHFTIALIQAHLHSHRTSYSHLYEKAGITEEELACDCIADAFARNAQNEFIRIQQCLSKLSASLENTSIKEIFLLYKSFILRFADVHLARLFAMFDSAGANIKRNITETIKRTNHFTSSREFSGTVLTPSNTDPLLHLSRFPFEELERQFLLTLDGKRTTESLLLKLHSILVEQDVHSRVLPLNIVVYLFKRGFPSEIETRSEENDEDDEFQFPSTNGYATEFELEDAIHKVFNTLKEKIFTMYLLSGKLTKKEAEGLFCALRDWVEDGRSSQEQLSLKEYFTDYISMNDYNYYERIGKKMDYLQKLLRQEFQSYFDEDV
ncbi:MAG: hypothetical protein KGZ58_14315 [Ignavibacteriales bacterium]|nr:hypothetical protein [Ignavibacteriales bacterium]